VVPIRLATATDRIELAGKWGDAVTPDQDIRSSGARGCVTWVRSNASGLYARKFLDLGTVRVTNTAVTPVTSTLKLDVKEAGTCLTDRSRQRAG
jgi:hypothetical protein